MMSHLYRDYSPEHLRAFKINFSELLYQWLDKRLPQNIDIDVRTQEVTTLPSESECCLVKDGAYRDQFALLASTEAKQILWHFIRGTKASDYGPISSDVDHIVLNIFNDIKTALTPTKAPILSGYANFQSNNLKKSGWFSVEVRLNETASLFFYCGPAYMDVLVGKVIPKVSDVVLSKPSEVIGNESVDLVAKLGPSSISVHDICHMRVGDVIPLDVTIENGATIHFSNGDPLGKGSIGKQKNKLAVRISNN